MKFQTWLLIISGFTLSLVISNTLSFTGDGVKLNKLTKPLRILGVFPYTGYSHFIMFKSLMKGLAERGHNVTVVSPFPLTSPMGNYTDVDLSDTFRSQNLNGSRLFPDVVAMFDSDIYSRVKIFATLSGPQLCKDTFTHPRVEKILKQKNQFDVVFTEVFGTDCFSVIGNILQVPTINMVTANTILWMHDYVGECNHPAVVPTHFLRAPLLDTLGARLQNSFYSVLSKILYYFEVTRPSEAVLREVLGESIPPLAEIRHNVSLVMMNSHPSIFGAKPSVPRVLQVAGIHLQPVDPRKMPHDVRDWLDTAPSGVLYFSLGSMVMGESLPARLRHAFITAFAELKPLRVLWKFEDKLTDLSDNVKVARWLPQVEILNHPKVLAFMSHAGLMGVIESVYYGVPVVGIPLFADQLINTNALVNLGCAVHLDHRDLTKEDVVQAVVTATTDPTVRRQAKLASQLFRDRPMPPLEEAIWWTEYIVRHGGAPHLESPTATMPFWQYALLDVLAVFVSLVLLAVGTIYFVISRLVNALSSKITRNKKRD